MCISQSQLLVHHLHKSYHRENVHSSNKYCTSRNIRLEFNSRSYAEDVTSVTSGASQGPHSFNLVFVCLCVCLFVCVTPGAIPYLTAKNHRDVINFSILLFFQAYPGIRTRTIAQHAFPHTLRIHTHSSKLLHVMILHLKALFEYCGQLYVASCV